MRALIPAHLATLTNPTRQVHAVLFRPARQLGNTTFLLSKPHYKNRVPSLFRLWERLKNVGNF